MSRFRRPQPHLSCTYSRHLRVARGEAPRFDREDLDLQLSMPNLEGYLRDHGWAVDRNEQ